ncbi:hypothetical protein M409DRAFT_23905 [Zasmidium cellare ATCC 36951]|uniref:EthD domain-containing protein n=1 Tax=Zasmidium cellare ATCC 36951 TaxID=1080233 RepID=A0A6A6CG41_ZASCE|nr:uncharacterized protein M409DRAFT_23905 [Zasmidium cellare ATCC 36951]KAF2165613.1 hypothetical protein M409DRAFT_23905 [Zasmidium cellare ATCC 36951]
MTLQKIDHQFQHPKLSYDAKPNYQPSVKLSFYFSKLPDVSDEQFHRHWETVHADLTVAAKGFKACKIQRYVQVHQTAEWKERAKSLGLVHLDFDGCSEIWVETWQDWMDFFNSEEYAKVMQPDCPRFMAFPISVFVGEENLIYGEALPGLKGADGVTSSTLQTRE